MNYPNSISFAARSKSKTEHVQQLYGTSCTRPSSFPELPSSISNNERSNRVSYCQEQSKRVLASSDASAALLSTLTKATSPG